MPSATNRADVLIIGGGLQGCSAALHLALRGLSVIVVEKDHAGRHASGLNAGGVRRLGRVFPEIPLSMAAAKLWHAIEELVEDDCGFKACGQVKVAETEAELAQLKERTETLGEHGFDHERVVDRETLRELLPAVAPHCAGGLTVTDDGYADPLRTVEAFKRRALALGAQFHEGAKVTSVERAKGTWRVEAGGDHFEAPILLNCAGAWGGRVAAMLGEAVPIRAAALMLMQTEPMAEFVTPVVGAQGRKLSLKQLADGSVMIGGGHEGSADPETNDTRLNEDELAISTETAATIFPVLKDAKIARKWAGIEGMMPDGIPVIGPGQSDGAFHAFGFSAHGFQLGPIVGEILSDLVVDGSTELPIEPFRIERFTGDREAEVRPRPVDNELQA